MPAKDLLNRLVQAIEARQPELVHGLLSEKGFEYIGPNTRIQDPGALAEYLLGMSAILKRISVRLMVAEETKACVTLDLETYFEPIGDVRVALVATTDGDRIGRLEAYYNASIVESMLRVED